MSWRAWRDTYDSALSKAAQWDTMWGAFNHRWEHIDPDHPMYRNCPTIWDSTHLEIPQPLPDPLSREFFWFNKPKHRGPAICFNVGVTWAREVCACSWWYSPKVSDAEMQADMDAEIPFDFDNPARPEFRLGDCHYSTCRQFITKVPRNPSEPLSPFLVRFNNIVSQRRSLVENVFANVKKFNFFKVQCRLGRQYDPDTLAILFRFACNLHNMEVRYGMDTGNRRYGPEDSDVSE